MQLGGLPGGRPFCSPPDPLRLVRARAHRRGLSRELHYENFKGYVCVRAGTRDSYRSSLAVQTSTRPRLCDLSDTSEPRQFKHVQSLLRASFTAPQISFAVSE